MRCSASLALCSEVTSLQTTRTPPTLSSRSIGPKLYVHQTSSRRPCRVRSDEVQRFPCLVLGGDIPADDQHTADVVFEINRTEAIRPPDIFATAVSRHGHQLVLVPGSSLACHDVFDLGADDVPYLIPTLAAPRSQRARMPLRPHRLTVGIVVELDEVGSPP